MALQKAAYTLTLLVTLFPFFGIHAQDLGNIKKEKPFTAHGNFTAALTSYSSKGFNSTMKPFGYMVSGAVNASIYGVQLPFNFFFSDQAQGIQQPFTQFGVAPSWKWIKGYVGYSNMYFCPTVMWGKTFLGAGVELHPGRFRFGAMYGRLRKKQEEDELPQGQLPAYQRVGYSVKIGMGTESNFFDFVFMKARDDSSSIRPLNIYSEQVAPEENAALGVNMKFTYKKKLVFTGDAAVSAFSRDTRSETIEINSGNRQFLSQVMKYTLTPRISSEAFKALHGNLAYRDTRFSISLDYRYVDPNYRAMGVDYLINDYSRIFLQTGFRLFKNTLFIDLSGGVQKDNLTLFKAATTVRNVYMANISYTSPKLYGFSFSYTNFLTVQRIEKVLISDTTRVENVSENLLFSPFYILNSTNYTHTFTIVYNMLKVDDQNAFTSYYADSRITNTAYSYSLYVTEHKLTLNPSLMFTKISLATGKISSVGITLSAGKILLEDKLNISAGNTYSINGKNSIGKGNTNNVFVNASYRIKQAHEVFFRTNIMIGKENNQTVSEFRGTFGYGYSF